MTLTLAQRTIIAKARAVGSGEQGVALSDGACAFLVGVIARDLRAFSRTGQFLSSNERQLLKKYSKQWIALYNGKVRAAAQSLDGVISKLEKQGLPANESIARNFQDGLARLGVDWFPSIEVSSLDVLEAYVSNGYGIGLTVIVPKTAPGPGVRLLPLPGFPPITIGALWQGKPTPLTQAFLNELQTRAKLLVP